MVGVNVDLLVCFLSVISVWFGHSSELLENWHFSLRMAWTGWDCLTLCQDSLVMKVFFIPQVSGENQDGCCVPLSVAKRQRSDSECCYASLQIKTTIKKRKQRHSWRSIALFSTLIRCSPVKWSNRQFSVRNRTFKNTCDFFKGIVLSMVLSICHAKFF